MLAATDNSQSLAVNASQVMTLKPRSFRFHEIFVCLLCNSHVSLCEIKQWVSSVLSWTKIDILVQVGRCFPFNQEVYNDNTIARKTCVSLKRFPAA